MNWKTSLDKYLTTPPDNGFNEWCDIIINTFSDSFYNENEDWIHEDDGILDRWLNNLHVKRKSPEEATQIIERAYNLLIKNKSWKFTS